MFDGGRLALDDSPENAFFDVARMDALRTGVSEPRRIARMLEGTALALPGRIVRYGELLSALKARLAGGNEA